MKENNEKSNVFYGKFCTVLLAVLLAVNTILAAVLIPAALGIAKDAEEALVSVQKVEQAVTNTAEEAVETLNSLDEAIEELDLDTLNSALAEINRTMGVLSDAAGALGKVANALKLLNIFK